MRVERAPGSSAFILGAIDWDAQVHIQIIHGPFREAQRFLNLSHVLPSIQDEVATMVEQLLVA